MILTVSDYSRRQLADFGVAPLSKIAVVHNGVDHLTSIAPDDSIIAKLGLQPGRFVTALANTQKHKNIRVLMEAFARPALRDTPLVLIGKSGAADFVAAGSPPPPNAVFAGPVSDAEMRALFAHAGCLAFPSTTEGFGLPPLEAMSLGCPVVAAPCGALPKSAATLLSTPTPRTPRNGKSPFWRLSSRRYCAPSGRRSAWSKPPASAGRPAPAGSSISSAPSPMIDGRVAASRGRRALGRLQFIVALGLAIVSIIGLVGRWNAWADIVNQFTPIWLCMALFGLVVLVARGKWRRAPWSGALVILALIAQAALAEPELLGAAQASSRADAGGRAPFSVLTFNV